MGFGVIDTVIEKEWDYKGYPCQVKADMGYRYGYVGVPKGHPYYGKDYGDIELDVHGGLVSSGDNPDSNLEDTWWLGFGCTHYGDLPDPKYAPQGFIHARALIGFGHAWTLPEVEAQVERMVDQLEEVKEAS